MTRFSDQPISRSRRIVFLSLCVLSPVALLAAIELLLRLYGLGGLPPLFRPVTKTPAGTLMIADVSKARSYFFANPDRPGYNDVYTFMMPKPTNTFRVLMAGGSAVRGYPQPRSLGMSSFLQSILQDVWPDRNVEIINVGATAIASFPMMEMAIEGLYCDPDLVVVYSGHNEFFGAYGVASINRAGAYPVMLKMHRRLRSFALVQAADRLLSHRGKAEDRTLMEIMVGQQFTAPDSWRREAAARNLATHVSEVIEACKARSIPVMVCTLPSNERDLAPIGLDDEPGSSPSATDAEILSHGAAAATTSPKEALGILEQYLATNPDNARAHYYLGKALENLDQDAEAHSQFLLARDLDTMPWRATSLSQSNLLAAARDHGALVCDVESAFREASPSGGIGWELMDDHVHPALPGQALAAFAMVKRLTRETGKLHVDQETFDRLPDWRAYAERLGDNPFDRYGVDCQMRVLFRIPFMQKSNPGALRRLESRIASFEKTLPPAIRKIGLEWQSRRPHGGGMRPITGMVARQLMREDKYVEARRLLAIARRNVPEYTSWHMEYVYFELACVEKINGKLDESDKAMAREEIRRAGVLLAHGFSDTGLTERYTGRLHQLIGEYEEAIPFLLVSRTKLTGFDLVAADQALFVSYVKTDNLDKARALAEDGAEHSGQYASFYRQLLANLDEPAAVISE